MANTKQWRGLTAMLVDAVEQGASAIERVHVQTARRPFEILKKVTPAEGPIAGIQAVHDSIVAGTYGSVRVVSRAVGKVLDVALDAIDDQAPAVDTATAAESDTATAAEAAHASDTTTAKK